MPRWCSAGDGRTVVSTDMLVQDKSLRLTGFITADCRKTPRMPPIIEAMGGAGHRTVVGLEQFR